VPYAQVREHLAELAAARLSLHLHMRPADVGSEALAELLKAADEQGVEVKAWLLLEEEGGLVYCSRYALSEYAAHARRVAGWLRAAGLPVRWLVFDCEPPPSYGRVVFAHMQQREYIKLWRFAREQADPAAFARAAAELRKLVSELQRDGFKVLGATVRPVIEGLIHRSLLAQDVLGVPFSMIPWDRVSFLVYRYDLSQPDYLAWVHRYACACRQHFGERGALDLGMIGGESILEGHLDRWGESEETMLRFLRHIAQPKDVRAGVAQAARCGLAHVHLYSLDGALASQIALPEWLRAVATMQPRASRWASVRAALVGRTLYQLFRIAMGGDGPVLRKLPLVAPEFRSAII
jgi:hypothetical protein